MVIADPREAAGTGREAGETRRDLSLVPAPVDPAAIRALLTRAQRPGRYAGGEWNSVVKDWASVELAWCLAYPELYEIGMSNLGLKILYEQLNDDERVLAERCFSPDADLRDALRAGGTPLWSLETRRPLAAFDVLGLSLGYELTFANTLELLARGGVALTTAERPESDPLVIAGGTATVNIEPIWDVLDAVVLGEGEDVVEEINELLLRLGWQRRSIGPDGLIVRGVSREAALRALATIPGVYVPSLYEARYGEDGAFAGLEPLVPEAKPRVVRRITRDFETRVRGIRQVVPNTQVVFDRAQLEVMRGCTRGCRFCLAGIQYRPVRERPLEVALEAAEAILRSTGFEEVSLTSLSTADYTHAAALATALRERHPDLQVSIPSTRVDSFTVELVDALEENRKGSFTFAPEAGSQRMRDVINKCVSDDEIRETAELAFGRGWTGLKLYFMVGLPGETMDDVLGIAEICRDVLQIGQRHHGSKAVVKAKISTFVPKPHTPFQWSGQDRPEVIESKIAALRKASRLRGLELTWHDTRSSLLEAVFSRGDRRLNAVVRRAWERGAGLDAWDQHVRYDAWDAAFADAGLDPVELASRSYGIDAPLPWEHLDVGVTRRFLALERRRALGEAQALGSTEGSSEGSTPDWTPKTVEDCHWGPCLSCGVNEATHFDCRGGGEGPRQQLLTLDSTPERPRWHYPGPPGSAGREAGAG